MTINTDMPVSGAIGATPIFATAEASYHIIPKFAVGVFSRLQFAPAFAYLVGARGRVFLSKPEKPLQLFINVSAGGGGRCDVKAGEFLAVKCAGGVSHMVSLPAGGIDYTLAGPIAIGPGFGIEYDFARNVGLYAAADIYVLLWDDYSAQVDINIGLRFGD